MLNLGHVAARFLLFDQLWFLLDHSSNYFDQMFKKIFLYHPTPIFGRSQVVDFTLTWPLRPGVLHSPLLKMNSFSNSHRTMLTLRYSDFSSFFLLQLVRFCCAALTSGPSSGSLWFPHALTASPSSLLLELRTFLHYPPTLPSLLSLLWLSLRIRIKLTDPFSILHFAIHICKLLPFRFIKSSRPPLYTLTVATIIFHLTSPFTHLTSQVFWWSSFMLLLMIFTRCLPFLETISILTTGASPLLGCLDAWSPSSSSLYQSLLITTFSAFTLALSLR